VLASWGRRLLFRPIEKGERSIRSLLTLGEKRRVLPRLPKRGKYFWFPCTENRSYGRERGLSELRRVIGGGGIQEAGNEKSCAASKGIAGAGELERGPLDNGTKKEKRRKRDPTTLDELKAVLCPGL